MNIGASLLFHLRFSTESLNSGLKLAATRYKLQDSYFSMICDKVSQSVVKSTRDQPPPCKYLSRSSKGTLTQAA